MPKNLVSGKHAEYLVISEFLKNEIEVFIPTVDDGIDFIIRIPEKKSISFLEVQVKSVADVNTTPLGGRLEKINDYQFHIIYYRDNKSSICLTPSQARKIIKPRHSKKDLGDYYLRKHNRKILSDQTLKDFISRIKEGNPFYYDTFNKTLTNN